MNDNSGVRYNVEDPVAVITLDRPAALNAFTWEMVAQLRDAVHEAVADPRVVGIIITGTGRGFCVGLDADAMIAATTGTPTPRGPSDHNRLPGMFSYLLEQPKPIIAAINGVAAGGGFLLATMCDLRIASTEASFVSVFARRGLTAELGVTWRLPQLIGTGNALDLLCSSRPVDAAEAFRIGLVERLTDPDALVDTARGYIATLAEQVAPTSIADIKRLVNTEAGMEIRPALTHAVAATVKAINTPDAREGAAAFVERRPPRFSRIGSGHPAQTDSALSHDW
jgi:enoyl-CoA hydratase/carnithine racemase